MNSRVRMGVMATGAALVALIPTLAESPVRRAPAKSDAAAPAAAPEPAVRVEHELVAPAVIEEHVEQRVENRPGISPAPERARPAASRTRLASRPETTSRPGLASRTRRLLLGDGRYRPEPFPRAGQ